MNEKFEMIKNYPLLFFAFAFIGLIMSSCSDHADKIVDTYSGVMTINDTLEINTDVVIEKTGKNLVNVSNSLFTTYSVEIDKKKYFASKSYFSVENEEHLEVYDDGLLTLSHNENAVRYQFNGYRN